MRYSMMTDNKPIKLSALSMLALLSISASTGSYAAAENWAVRISEHKLPEHACQWADSVSQNWPDARVHQMTNGLYCVVVGHFTSETATQSTIEAIAKAYPSARSIQLQPVTADSCAVFKAQRDAQQKIAQRISSAKTNQGLNWTRDLVFEAPSAGEKSTDTIKFDIARYEIVGSKLLSPERLQQQVQAFTGKGRVYGDIQKALESLEQVYQSEGYGAVTVYVPEQDISTGVVTIQVTEALLAQVVVEGAKHHSDENILAAFPSLTLGLSPKLMDISSNTQLANENASKKNSVVLSAGAQESSIKATIKVEDEQPVQWIATADNNGNSSTGEHRLGLLFQHHNLFNQDHSLTLGYTTSPEKKEDVKIFSAGYRIPLYRFGDSVDVMCGYSDVTGNQSMGVLGSTNFVGKGRVCSARYNWLLPRSGETTSRFVLGMDHKAFDQVELNQLDASGNPSLAQVPAYEVRPLSLSYVRQLQQPGFMLDMTLGVSQNFADAQLGSDARINSIISKDGYRQGNADYRIYKAGVSALMLVNENRWQWRNALTLQKADEALVSGEQWGLGGSMSVRGLPERAFSVDEGYLLTSELTLSDIKSSLNLEGSLLPAVFFDHGQGANQGFNRNASNAATVDKLFKSISATSVGMGLRYRLNNLFFKFDVARLLSVDGRTYDNSPSSDLLNKKMQATQAFYENEDNAWRIHGSMMIKF